MVKWKDSARECKDGNRYTLNNIYGINQADEVILNRRVNSYFIIDLFLTGESHAEEVYSAKGEVYT